MRSIQLFIFLFCVCIAVSGQNTTKIHSLNELYLLDTIIKLNINLTDLEESNEIKPVIYKNYVYVSYYNKINNAIEIERLCLLDNKATFFSLKINDRKVANVLKAYGILSADFYNDTLLLHTGGILLLINLAQGNKILKISLLRINGSYGNYIRSVKNYSHDHIFFASDYNYESFNRIKNYAWGLINKKTGLIDTFVTPQFDGIEFSHFQKNIWINSYNKKIINSQTILYKLNIIDRDGNVKEVEREHPNWKYMDQRVLNEISSETKPTRQKDIIPKLVSYHNGGASRIVSNHFINDTSILVTYIIPNPNKAGFLKNDYYSDIWTLDNNEWRLSLVDIEDNPRNDTTEKPVLKESIPILHWLYPCYISDSAICTIRKGADVLPYGRKQSDINAELKKYYSTNDPFPVIYIYKIK